MEPWTTPLVKQESHSETPRIHPFLMPILFFQEWYTVVVWLRAFSPRIFVPSFSKRLDQIHKNAKVIPSWCFSTSKGIPTKMHSGLGIIVIIWIAQSMSVAFGWTAAIGIQLYIIYSNYPTIQLSNNNNNNNNNNLLEDLFSPKGNSMYLGARAKYRLEAGSRCWLIFVRFWTSTNGLVKKRQQILHIYI